MPTPRKPKYSHHKATNQARVWIDGKDHYLGDYGSPESHERYDKLIVEWLTRQDSSHPITVDELCLLYLKFAKIHYRKNGRETSEVGCIKSALKPVARMFGTKLASNFGPKFLKRVRDAMITAGIVRSSINIHMGRVRRMFKWAVADELVSPNVLVALQAVAGLKTGRSDAIETDSVKPVAINLIDAVKPFVSRQVWAMIQLQLVTAARPGEVRSIRSCDLNMAGKIWEYIPESHKTEHHGKRRMIFIGPQGQSIIREFLKSDTQAYLFSPTDSRAEFDAKRREGRKSPMTPSQLARRRKRNPKRRPGWCYSVYSYRQAIANACKKADIDAWHPNQLRHNAATNLRREFGIEAARTVLGHSSAVTSEIYAEMDFDKARTIIGKIG